MRARHLVRVLPFILAIAFLAMTASSAFAASATLPLSINANGHVFSVPASCVTSSSVDTATTTYWLTKCVAPLINTKAVNAASVVNKKKKRLDFKASKNGYAMDTATSVSLLLAKLASVTTTSAPEVLVLPGSVVKPKVAKMGRQILVVQSQRKIYLYDGSRVIKTFRCAVGQKSWPTPNGTFHIGKKVKNPTWTNGYASWSKNMPSYIGPGVNNPLGTRAMYVYTGTRGGHDTGVRFHGVPHSEDSSIGHAASHGCMRMHRKDVEKFFPMVPLGTLVYIIK